MPVLLDLPAPRLPAPARETVIAEKFQAMVMLGRANSRLKDLYDIWMLSRIYEFTDDRLARALAATFACRKTALPVELPDALTQGFAEDVIKRQQWDALRQDVSGQAGDLREIVNGLAAFLMPHVERARLIGRKPARSRAVGSQGLSDDTLFRLVPPRIVASRIARPSGGC